MVDDCAECTWMMAGVQVDGNLPNQRLNRENAVDRFHVSGNRLKKTTSNGCDFRSRGGSLESRNDWRKGANGRLGC